MPRTSRRRQSWPGARSARDLVTGQALDEAEVATTALRVLMYELLPGWVVPGLLDYRMHRRTRIETTSGTRESLLHAAMMACIGTPILLALLCEINPAVLCLMAASAIGHEALAVWDVRLATGSPREVRPAEHHIHSFLETLPTTALAMVSCLHTDAARALVRGGRGGWALRLKRPAVPGRYAASIGALASLGVAVPYAEELCRCLAAGRRA